MAAVDGQDVLNKFKVDAGYYKLIVTDLIMPRMSGKQVYDEIRQIKPDMKALFCSGYSAKIIGEQGEIGANAEFMVKSILLAVLLEMACKLLDRPVK